MRARNDRHLGMLMKGLIADKEVGNLMPVVKDVVRHDRNLSDLVWSAGCSGVLNYCQSCMRVVLLRNVQIEGPRLKIEIQGIPLNPAASGQF